MQTHDDSIYIASRAKMLRLLAYCNFDKYTHMDQIGLIFTEISKQSKGALFFYISFHSYGATTNLDNI